MTFILKQSAQDSSQQALIPFMPIMWNEHYLYCGKHIVKRKNNNTERYLDLLGTVCFTDMFYCGF